VRILHTLVSSRESATMSLRESLRVRRVGRIEKTFNNWLSPGIRIGVGFIDRLALLRGEFSGHARVTVE